MKQISTILVLFFAFSVLAYYSIDPIIQDKPEIGDILIISKIKNDNYKFIKFPKPNILHKRGAIADYSKIYGAEVVITEVKENKFGRLDVKLVRTDEKKFFNKIKSVSANYFKAIDFGELLQKQKS